MSSEMSVTDQKKATATLIALWEQDTVQAAADALGVTRKAVYERINKYGLREKLSEMNTMGEVVLHMGVGKAADNLVNKLDSDDERISIDASKEILDRTGVTKRNDKGAAVNVNFNQFVQKERDEFDIT